MPKAVLTDEQMAALEAQHTPTKGRVLSDDEMSQLEAHHNSQSGKIDTPSWVPEGVKNVAGMLAAKQAGALRSASLGYLDPEKIPGVSSGFKEASAEHPIVRAFGSMEGSVVPGALMGEAAAPLAAMKYLNNPVGRTAVNAGMGGIEGLIRKPEEGQTRLGNAKTGAITSGVVGGVMEALSGVADLGGWLSQRLGRKFGGLSVPEAESYARSPVRSEELAKKAAHDPMGLNQEVKEKIGGGLETAFDRVSQPQLDKLSKMGLGKTVQVNPGQFKGTAAEPEILRAWNLRGPERSASYNEIAPYEAKMTPVQPKYRFGAPEEQTAHLPNRPYDSPEVAVQTIDKSIVKAGPEQIVSRGFTRGPLITEETAPRQIPESMAITWPQAMAAKRATGNAAAFKRALNPQGYSPADDAEAQAFSRLKAGMEGVAPEAKESNRILEEAARYSGQAKDHLGQNPAAILTDSDSLGSGATRSMRQFLDTHGDAGLEEMANQLAAGRKLGEPKEAESIRNALSRQAARGLLKGSAKADSAKQILRDMKIRSLFGAEAGTK